MGTEGDNSLLLNAHLQHFSDWWQGMEGEVNVVKGEDIF